MSLSLSTHMHITQNMHMYVYIYVCVWICTNLLGKWKPNKKQVVHIEFLYKLHIYNKYMSVEYIQNILKCTSLNAISTIAGIKYYCKYY